MHGIAGAGLTPTSVNWTFANRSDLLWLEASPPAASQRVKMPVVNVKAPGAPYCCAGALVNTTIPCVLIGTVAMPEVADVPNNRKAEDAVTLPIQIVAVAGMLSVHQLLRTGPIFVERSMHTSRCASIMHSEPDCLQEKVQRARSHHFRKLDFYQQPTYKQTADRCKWEKATIDPPAIYILEQNMNCQPHLENCIEDE
jgi:hypothetical protein